MATVSQVQEATYVGGFRNEMSAGADAATKSMQGLGTAVEQTDTKVTRAGKNAEQLAKTYDLTTARVEATSKVTAKYARDLAALEVETQRYIDTNGKAGVSDQQAATIRTGIAAKQAADLQKVEQRLRSNAEAYRLIDATAAGSSGGMNAVAKANDNVFTATGRSTGAMIEAAKSARAHQNTMLQLGAQMQDFAIQVAGGQNVLLAFVQQGSQAAFIMGGFGNAIRAAAGAIFSGVGAVVALTAAFAVGVAASQAYQSSMRELATAIKVGGSAAGVTAGQLEDLAQSTSAATRLSVKEVRGLEGAYLSTGQVAGAVLAGLVKITEDYAALTGTKAADAGASLAKSFADPAQGAKQLDAQLHILSDSEHQQIKNLTEQGKKTEAQAILLDALSNRVKGAAQDVGFFAKAWDTASTAVSNWFDRIGKTETLADRVARLRKINDDARATAGQFREGTAARSVVEAGARGTQGQLDDALADQREQQRLAVMSAQSAAIRAQGIAAGDLGRAMAPLVAEKLALTNQEILLTNAIKAELVVVGLMAAALDLVKARLVTLKPVFQEQVEALGREQKIMSASMGSRDSLRAKLEAEVEARKRTTSETAIANAGRIAEEASILRSRTAAEDQLTVMQAETAGLRDVTAARTRGIAAVNDAQAASQARIAKLQNEAVNENSLKKAIIERTKAMQTDAAREGLIELDKQTEGLGKITAAYAVSEAAGRSMELQVRAEGDARKNASIAIDEQTAAYVKQASAQAALDATKLVRGLDGQLEAQKRLTAAALLGTEASAEAARVNAVEAAFKDKLAAATDKDRDAILKDKAAYDERTKAILEEQKALERSISLRDADRAVSSAAAKAHASLITDPNEQRAAEMAIARQERLNELTDKYGADIVAIQERMSRFDRAAAFEEQARFWDDVRNKAEDASKDVSRFLADGLVNAGKGGKSVFKDMFDAGIAGAKRFAVSMATEILRQKFILPIAMQVIGGAPGAFGIASPQGSAAGANPLSYLQAAGQAKDGISFLNNPLGSLSNLFSPNNFIANAFPSLFGATTTTAAATGLGGVAAEGMLATTTMGPLAGLAPFLPALAIALPLLLSFFMNRKESVGPNANTVINYERDADGRLVRSNALTPGGSGADNGGDASIAKKMAEAATKGFNSVLDRLGAKLTGFDGAGDIASAQLYYFEKTKKYGAMVGGAKEEFDTAEEAVANFIKRSLQHGTIEGLSDDVKLALTNTRASSIEELGKDIDFAANFRRSVNLAAAGPGTREAQALQFQYAGEDYGLSQRNANRDYIADARRLFGADSTQFADAQATSRRQLLGLMEPAPAEGAANAPLQGMAAEVARVTAQFNGLKNALIDTGLSADEAQAKIDAGIKKTFRKIADDQEKAINDAIFAATSPAASGVKDLAAAQKKRRNDYIDAHKAAGDPTASLAGVYTLDRIEAGAAMIGMTRAQLDEVAKTMHDIGDASPGMYDALQQAYAFADFMVSFGKMNVDISRWSYEAAKGEKELATAKQDYIDAINKELEAVDAQISAAEQAKQSWSSLAATMKSTRLGLLLDKDLSPFSPQQRYNEATSQFDTTYAKAQGGDLTAAQQMPDIARAFLQASREWNAGNTVAYGSDFQKVQDALLNTEDLASHQADAIDAQLVVLRGTQTTLRSTLAEVQGQSANLKTIADAAAAYHQAQTTSATTTTTIAGQQLQAFQGMASSFSTQYAAAASQTERDTLYNATASQRDTLINSITDVATLQAIGHQYYEGNTTDSGARAVRQRLYGLGAAPTFGTGGFHAGGLRIVGEHGPEIEATGSARYWSTHDLGQIMGAANDRFGGGIADLNRFRERSGGSDGQGAMLGQVAKNTGAAIQEIRRGAVVTGMVGDALAKALAIIAEHTRETAKKPVAQGAVRRNRRAG